MPVRTDVNKFCRQRVTVLYGHGASGDQSFSDSRRRERSRRVDLNRRPLQSQVVNSLVMRYSMVESGSEANMVVLELLYFPITFFSLVCAPPTCVLICNTCSATGLFVQLRSWILMFVHDFEFANRVFHFETKICETSAKIDIGFRFREKLPKTEEENVPVFRDSTGSVLCSPSVKEAKSEDGAVLLDVEQGLCFSLNSVGCRIWELLKQGLSSDELVNELEKQYTVPREQLVQDIHEFIDDLECRRLVLIDKKDGRFTSSRGSPNRFWSVFKQRER